MKRVAGLWLVVLLVTLPVLQGCPDETELAKEVGSGVRGGSSSPSSKGWTVSTLAYSASILAGFNVAVDSAGTIYVVDTAGSRVRKVTSSGTLTTVAGSKEGFSSGFADGNGTEAQFDGPEGITVDKVGNVYVADTGNHRIRKITPSGTVTTVAGSVEGLEDGTGVEAQFRAPVGLSADRAGNLYVADKEYYLRKVTPSGLVTTLQDQSDANYVGPLEVISPRGIATDDVGNLYVAEERSDGIIYKISSSGVASILAGGKKSSGEASTGNGGHLLWRTLGLADGAGSEARFNGVQGLVVDASGDVYVADTGNNCIRMITPDGFVSTLAGGTEGYVDGAGTEAAFRHPSGIALDNAGNLYVSDVGNKRIRKLSKN